MTTDELRDELAREMGYRLIEPTATIGYMHWVDAEGWPVFNEASEPMSDHECPIPATLDGAAAAMPEGFKWSKHGTYGRARCATYRAYAANNKMLAMVPDTGNEVHDRYSLALAARKAQETHR